MWKNLVYALFLLLSSCSWIVDIAVGNSGQETYQIRLFLKDQVEMSPEELSTILKRGSFEKGTVRESLSSGGSPEFDQENRSWSLPLKPGDVLYFETALNTIENFRSRIFKRIELTKVGEEGESVLSFTPDFIPSIFERRSDRLYLLVLK